MNIQRRLGRGLEALLGQPDSPIASQQMTAAPQTEVPAAGPTQLSVYEIDSNPYQPRQEFDEAEIESLAQSIREHGVIQAVIVRRVGQRYQLIAGERRLRAAIKAGKTQVPAQVREADDRQMAELAIIENLQRKDLNALEKATCFQQYLATYSCKQEELAARLSIDRSTVANLIRLLDLPRRCATSVAQRHHLRRPRPSAAHCRRRAKANHHLQTNPNRRSVCKGGGTISTGFASVCRQRGALRRRRRWPIAPVVRTRSKQNAALEQEFRSALGTKVQISQTAKGRGKIVIHFSNHDEFDRIRQHLTHSSHHKSQAG